MQKTVSGWKTSKVEKKCAFSVAIHQVHDKLEQQFDPHNSLAISASQEGRETTRWFKLYCGPHVPEISQVVHITIQGGYYSHCKESKSAISHAMLTKG